MYSLGQIKGQSHQLQAQFSRHINKEIWHREPLIQEDFLRIADLFKRYNSVPAGFADLSLSEIFTHSFFTGKICWCNDQ